jgi:hypothetical protein
MYWAWCVCFILGILYEIEERTSYVEQVHPSVHDVVSTTTRFSDFHTIFRRSSFQMSSKPEYSENLLSDSHTLLERRKLFYPCLHQGFTNTGWLNFVMFSLKLFRPECETCFMSPYGAWNFEGAPWYVENLWKTAAHISWPIWVKFHLGDVRVIPVRYFVLVDAGNDILIFLT